MGITFLAAGTSVPEAVSSVIVAKQGKVLCEYEKKIIHYQYSIIISKKNIYI